MRGPTATEELHWAQRYEELLQRDSGGINIYDDKQQLQNFNRNRDMKSFYNAV